MIGMMLILATQQSAEVTPSLSAMSITTGTGGTCLTTPLQPATIVVSWTAVSFNGATQDFKIYRDGVLVATQDSTTYALQLAGLVENNTHNQQSITFNYRVDVVRSSDNVVLVTRSASVTKSYGNCA